MPKYVNVDGIGKVAFPDGLGDDEIKAALDKEYGQPQAAPIRGALSSVEQAAGTIPKAAATLIESEAPAIERNKVPMWMGEEGAPREPMTFDRQPGYRTPTIPPAYSLRPRTPAEVLKAVPENPLFKIGQTAQESVPMSTLQEKSNWTKAGEMAGSGAEMALGPLAIPAYAAQPLGEVTDEFENIKRANPHMNVNEAADQAFTRSIEKGALTAGTFYAIPKALRGPLEKYLVNKFGTTGFKNWVAGRAAASTEGAVLGGAQAAGQQAMEGQRPDINTAKSAAGFAMMNALLPWRRAQKGGPNAQAVRSDTGQVRPTGGQPQGVQNQGGQNIQQPPPGQPQPVGAREEAKVSLRAKNYDVQFDDESGRWVVLDPANNVVKDLSTQGAAVAHANELHDKDEAATKALREKTDAGHRAAEAANKEQELLSKEDQAHIDSERGTVDVPVEIVKTGTTEADEPFAKDLQRLGGISTVDRKSGRIVINPTEFHDWLQGIPVEQRPQAVRSLLSEERIHLATTDADADAYFKSLSGIERAIGKRRYSGSWSGKSMPDMNDTLWGHEALRTRMQQLARMTPREIAEASGRERWTLQSITALESVVRNIREKMGTNASKEALSILDRIGANLKAGKVVAAGSAPMATQKDVSDKTEQELRDEANKLRSAGNEPDAKELEGMADWLKQRGSEQSFPMARKKVPKEQMGLDDILGKARFEQMRMASTDPKIMKDARRQMFKDAMDSLAPREPMAMQSSNRPNPAAEKVADEVGGLKYIGNWQVKDKGYWMFNITQPGRETTMVVPEGVSKEDLQKKRDSKIAEYDAAEKSPMARPKKRRESIFQEAMGFILPSVNTGIEAVKEGPQQPPVTAEKAGALPPLSAAEIEGKAADWMKSETISALDKVRNAPTSGGSVALPKFKEFAESMRKKQGGVQPGQLKELWQKTVNDTLSNASDDQLRALTQAAFGRESRLARFARAALSFTKETPPLELKGEVAVAPKSGESAESHAARLKRAKLGDRSQMFEEKASERQEAKEERAAPRRRRMIVAALFKKMVLPAYREDALPQDRKTVTPSEIRNGGGKLISAYQSFDATGQDDPELANMLVDESRRSGEDPVTTTKRLTVIMDKKSGKVSMVSTYKHPTKGTMLVDQAHPQGHHAPLEDMQRRYRVLYSVLLDQPVKGFKRNFDSVADYNAKFGDEARENYTRETSYDPNAVSIPEFMSEVEGSEGVEGEGGDLMGPGKRAAMAVTGVGEGAVEKASFTPITGVERDAIIDHMNSELGDDPHSVDDTRAILDDLAIREGKQPPAVLSGLQKLAQMLQRENPGMPTEDLVNLMAKRLYEDKNLEATVAATEKAAAAKAGPATRPEVPEAASQTSRDLSMLNRRPPTDVRPENVPIGTEQPAFLHNPPVPVATVTPRDPEYLSPEAAQYVNELALQNHPGYVPTDPEAQTIKPHEETKLLKERSPMARSKPMDELDQKRRQINANWLRRATNRIIKMTADGVDNAAALEGERARRSLRLLNPDEMIRSAPIALLSTGKIGENPKTGKKFFFYDPKMIDSKITQARLGSTKAEAILNDPKADRQMKKYAGKWKEAADRLHLIAQYVKDHWTDKDMRDMAAGVRRELYDQLLREHAAGVSTTDFGETYFPTRYEGEMFNLDTITFGEDRIIGNRFTARKKFRDHYEAVMNGPFVPKSYDSADIIGHRVRQGMKSVARSTWHEALKDMKDSASGRPVAMAPVPTHPRNLVDMDTGDKVFHHDSWEAPSPEYELVYPTPSSQPVAVLKPYSDLVNTLMEKSAFQGKPLGEFALYSTSILKHGVVLVADTFHPSRLIQYASAVTGGKPSVKPGLVALMYRAEDLDAAVKAGEVHPDEAKWAREKVAVMKDGVHTLTTKQEILEDMVKKGLNATRIGDALYKDAIQKIPIVGEYMYHGVKGYGLGWYNKLVFDKLIPGLISSGAVRSFMKMHEANPDIPYEKLMRDVITDMNTIYGNMGRQGVFASATFRDAAQVFMLAPMWQEGLIGKEIRTIGRLTGISNLTGRRGLPQMGVAGSAVLRGLAAYFVLTQAINLINRGQTTFQNKEKGHQLDAWWPTGKDSGIWISPLSVFAEKTHDLIRLAETKPKVWDAITQIGENTLGPFGKMAAVLYSGRSPMGEVHTTTGGVVEDALSQLAPVPISAGKPLAWAAYAAGIGKKPEPGTTARQIAASFLGVKTQPGQDANTQVEAAGRKFAQDNMLRADSQVIIPTDEPSYAKMRHAFKIGDDKTTKQLFDALMDKRKPWESRGDRAQQILADMQHWARRPLTGSLKGDMLWKHSMTDDERKLYGEAIAERMEILYGWEKWYLQERSGPH